MVERKFVSRVIKVNSSFNPLAVILIPLNLFNVSDLVDIADIIREVCSIVKV